MTAACTGPECDRDARTKGLCDGHYQQLYRGEHLRPLQNRVAAPATPAPSMPVVHVMRELARLGIDYGDTRVTAERIARQVDDRAVADAIAADCYQLALSKLVDAADHTADSGGPAFDQALAQARELLERHPGQEAA